MKDKTNIIITSLAAFLIFCGASWLINIYKFTQLDFASGYKAEVIRGVSIFPLAPLSVVTAWVSFDEELKEVAPKRSITLQNEDD